ncbi:putative protein N(5)-glutamine methyltransferase [Gordonia insulae]|uniref:peptide chain release factor N(5)-glutamine methyltransferase n=1 Tax=Gordonia insulae TaxID=2420509 RepID=A0A3G8JEI1_9ACTN|nr:putative protein N(5)-glutamine methyltransferase [Gordonia insulae]AZG43601.1 Release factor glutamine methyltransferase [Gordonia insulae]
MKDVGADVVSRTVSRLRDAGCVFAEEEAELIVGEAADATELDIMVARRMSGVPLEVILGWVGFHGLRVEVDAGVFVPRRRTSFLVRQAVTLTRPRAVVVDLCCGTGAIGLAVAAAVPHVELHACDVDPVAVRNAARNVGAVGGHTWCGDLFAPLPTTLLGRVHVVVVNAPYVPTAEIALMPAEARDHEPHHSLDGGVDGVAFHRRIGAEVGRWLIPGGHVLIETSEGQAELSADALSRAGLDVTLATSEDLGATAVIGRRRE